LHYFLKLKTIENDLKSAAQCWAEIGPRLQRTARRLATCGRPEGRLGHSLAAHALRAPSALQRRHRAQDGVVARSLAAW
jgi:hypothetical protein